MLASMIARYSGVNGASWPSPQGFVWSNEGWPPSPRTMRRFHWPVQSGYLASSNACAATGIAAASTIALNMSFRIVARMTSPTFVGAGLCRCKAGALIFLASTQSTSPGHGPKGGAFTPTPRGAARTAGRARRYFRTTSPSRRSRATRGLSRSGTIVDDVISQDGLLETRSIEFAVVIEWKRVHRNYVLGNEGERNALT